MKCIDILIYFQQNELAIDVARRKDHPEIILAITSQPKTKKDKKKRFGKHGADEEKKEKRGFFFRRKHKTKVCLRVVQLFL